MSSRAPGADSGLASRQATLILSALIALGVLLRLVVFRGQGFPSDVGTFMAWAERMVALGPGGFYAPGYFSDYPPAFLYVLWLAGAAFDGEALRLAVKLLSVPADIAIAVFVARLVTPAGGPRLGALAGGIWMAQPGVILAGPFWGQVDAWGALPFLGALVAAGRGRWALAGALAGVAGMVKPQFGLVALVVAGAAAIELVQTRRWRPLALVAGSGLGVALALAIPFRMTPGAYVDLVREAAETYPYTSLYAFNVWSVFGDFWKPDAGFFVIGGALLALGLAGSLLPLWRRRDVAAFLAAGAFAAMAFYFLPTRAHERYLFPAFALILPFAVLRPRVRLPYAVLSVAFFVTLYFAFTRYPFTEVAAPALIEATLFGRAGQIALALVMMVSAAAVAWYLARGEARLRPVPGLDSVGDVRPPARTWRLPAGLRLGYAPTRRDVALALLVALAVIATRGYRLDHPRDMYFDEVYHARTAFELVAQREPYEWTHPHLAKEIMAVGILAFGGDRVEATVPPPTGPEPVTAFAVSNTGQRAYGFADGSVRLEPVASFRPDGPLTGPIRALAFEGERLFVLTGRSVDQVSVSGTEGGPRVDHGGSPPTSFAVVGGRAVVGTQDDLRILEVVPDAEPVVLDIPVAALTAKPGSSEVYVADPTGAIHVVDVTTGRETGSPLMGGPPVSALAYARGPDRVIGAELGAGTLVWYEPAEGGSGGGSYGGSVSLRNPRTADVAGDVRALALVPRSQLLYALTERGVVVVEPHGMSPFAAVPASGTMLGIDGTGDEVLVAGEGATERIPTGRHALAWRIPGVAFAAVLAFFVVLLARRLFASPVAPAIAGAVVLLDGSMFAQARIGMNDVYVATFIVMGWYFVVAAHRPRRSAYLDLLVAGVCFGLALASKWVAAYALAGLALFTLGTTAVAWARGRPGTGGPFDLLAGPVARWPARPALRLPLRPLILLAFFAALPAAVYLGAYLPWFGGPTLPFGWNLVELTQQMYWYHSGLTAPHPAGSPWWSWPLVLKPVYWYLGSPGGGQTAVIYDAGNVVLFWGGLAAVVWAAIAAWRARSVPLAFLLFALLIQYVPWIPISRVLFFYHFFTALPFYLLILAAALAAMWERGRAPFVSTYLAIAAGAFLFFYPFVSGQPLAADQAAVFFVLPTWQYECQFYPAFRCETAFGGDIPLAAAAGRVAVALGAALLVLAGMTLLLRDGQRDRLRAWAARLVPRRAERS
ncbi:MAG: phospholipid carrier-dependent glycosyltransferase [Candidatus Limnocylindria bacterium]